MKNIIKAVEKLDFIVNKIIHSTGMKIGIIEFLNDKLFNERFLANNNIKLNFANSEGWKVKPKILIQRLASTGLLKSSSTYDGVNNAQNNNTIETINKINEKLVKYLYGIFDTILIIIKPDNRCMECMISRWIETE